MEVRNILVPIDFSECSKSALVIAIRLAKKWESHIHLVHAISLPMAHADMGNFTNMSLMLEGEQSQIKMRFEGLLQDVPELSEVNYHIRQCFSNVADAIKSESEAKMIDLIVMGTKSSHDMIEHFLGSITSEVILSASIPVLMIPEGLDYSSIKKIGFAADFNTFSGKRNITIVSLMVEVFDASIIVFNISKLGKSAEAKKIPSVKKLKQQLAAYDVKVLEMKESDVALGIKNFVDQNHLDMVVMLPRQHDFFDKILGRSTTKKLANTLKIPLLAIP